MKLVEIHRYSIRTRSSFIALSYDAHDTKMTTNRRVYPHVLNESMSYECGLFLKKINLASFIPLFRVDGLYLRYWYIPGFGADTGCSDGKSKYDSRNDLAELCRQMMRAHGVHKELWAAYVRSSIYD